MTKRVEQVRAEVAALVRFQNEECIVRPGITCDDPLEQVAIV
jgi:hypothetical protein